MSLHYNCMDPITRRAGIKASYSAVKNGELIVVPTDTVYGLGCDAFNPEAVRRLLSAKDRGRDMPVGVLVSSWQALEGLTLSVPKIAQSLVESHWPGALSIIISHAPSLMWDLGDARGTVMVRMPSHPVILEILEQTGPMAVSSANISGKPPAVTVEQAEEQLGELVSVYLDGGKTSHLRPSTVVDVSDTVIDSPAGAYIVREGAISASDIATTLNVQQELLYK